MTLQGPGTHADCILRSFTHATQIIGVNSLHVNSMACGIAYVVNALGSYEATLAHV
jgi:hypothetical protein